jgi:Fe-S oxidoreductase
MIEGSTKAPTRHPVDWQNPDFYDEVKLDAELRRVFDICHGCRRCFNLCDSFPRLFDLIDASPSGEVHDVKSENFKPVVDACTLCDMCFMTKCPYVPPHEFNLDFPHLMLRYRAVEAHKGEVTFAEKQLTDTDRNGSIAKFVAPFANWATSTQNTLTRTVLEKVAHVHHEAVLPTYSSETFVNLASRTHNRVNTKAPAFGKRKAVIYATCSMNFNDAELGMVVRNVLAHIGIPTEVVYPSCCGMPQLEQGDIGDVVTKASKVANIMQNWINDGYDVVALVPSCALMLKLEWPLLVPAGSQTYDNVTKLAAATFDLSEYIVEIANKHGLTAGMKPLTGPVALHLACHARAQNMGAKAAEMLTLLPQSEDITILERCSGHGGSWGIMTDNFEVALKVGKPVAKKAADVLKQAEETQKPGFIASECPLAALHIAQGVQKLDGTTATAQPKSYHPIEIFAMSYGITRGSR